MFQVTCILAISLCIFSLIVSVAYYCSRPTPQGATVSFSTSRTQDDTKLQTDWSFEGISDDHVKFIIELWMIQAKN